jgi:tetratricopeptide (TPR) repeat protein
MTRIIDEIRRRKVGRVAVAYAAAAFVALQVADIVLPALDTPGWVLTVLVVVAALGFPVAVALAWAFDVTPDGVQRTPPTTPVAVRGRTFDRRGLAVVAVVALVSLGAGGGYLWSRYAGAADLDPDLVVILPFRVSADPSIAYLREGMVDLLATSLSAESGLRAAEPRTALSAWRRVARDETVDLAADEAKQVARAVGAGQVVLGSVLSSGREVTLTASLVRLAGGRSIEARVQGNADEITRLIDELCAQLLSRAAGESETRLEALTSTSLPALRAYLEGQVHYRRSQFGQAAAAFDRAVGIDSTFALAALNLQMTIGWGDADTPNQPRAARLAHRYRDRLSPLDRIMLDAQIGAEYPQERSIAQRLADWERAFMNLPERADAYFLYGDLLIHYGALVDRSDHVEASGRAFRRSLAIDSSFTPALVHLLDNALFEDDLEEARRLFELLVRTDSSAQAATYQYFMRLIAFGDAAQLAAYRNAFDTLPPFQLRSVVFTYIWPQGDVADSRRAVDVNLRTALTPQQRNTALADAYLLAMNLGRPQEALGYAQQALALPGVESADWHARLMVDVLFWDGNSDAAARAAAAAAAAADPPAFLRCARGQWLAWQGEHTAARAEADALVQREPGSSGDTLSEVCAVTLLAIAAHAAGAGEADTLLERADSLAATGPAGDIASLRALNLSLARLFEARGSPDRALRAVNRHVILPEMMNQYSALHLGRAQLAHALGDAETARAAYTEFLRLRSDPEPSLLEQRAAVERALLGLTGERAN